MCIRDRFGRDRHPAECDCQKAQRLEREAAEQRRKHLDTVEMCIRDSIKTLYDKFKGLSLKDKTTEETAGADVTLSLIHIWNHRVRKIRIR